MTEVINAADFFRIYSDNSLETYRAESLLTKEPETVKWIDGELREGDTFFDIGANVGIYSLYAAKIRPSCRVLAFEPVLANFLRLCQNVELNGFVHVSPFLLGFSDKDEVGSLEIPDARIGGSGAQILGRSLPPRPEGGRRQAVLIQTLDRFVLEMGAPVPAMVKIDVDGVEDKIVRGMSRLLRQPGLRTLLVEVNKGQEALVSFIRDHGLSTDNPYNTLEVHSRNRRKAKSDSPENVIFTRNLGA